MKFMFIDINPYRAVCAVARTHAEKQQMVVNVLRVHLYNSTTLDYVKQI